MSVFLWLRFAHEDLANAREVVVSVRAPELYARAREVSARASGKRRRSSRIGSSTSSKTNSHAHYKAISTYFSLCKETITNKECRDFLLLNNRNEAKRILSNSGLLKCGKSSATYYKQRLY